MILLDVNVLIYAFRQDADRHAEFRDWLRQRRVESQPFGMAELVLAAFVRIVTNARIFREPDSLNDALRFTTAVQSSPNLVKVVPGPRHWEIFTGLCREVSARGNLVADAYLAALALESGTTWITTDRDFARFPGLRWRHPLDPVQ
ncbi:MAG: type II toxin-antitoxin system VapC family toxin [Terriglobales bacterium]